MKPRDFSWLQELNNSSTNKRLSYKMSIYKVRIVYIGLFVRRSVTFEPFVLFLERLHLINKNKKKEKSALYTSKIYFTMPKS